EEMSIAAIEVHRWTREDYERMTDQGFLGPETRAELIDGIIYDMAPQRSGHATGVLLAQEELRAICPPGFSVRAQTPLVLGDDSEPEPDVAVVPGSVLDYSKQHPTTALLIVEVADTSILHDRGRKRDLYARHGIPEIWISDLKARKLEVYRDPSQGIYRSRVILTLTDTIAPLFSEQTPVAVSRLFPPD
ncbi:MAG TPA: Uma2 family endonuclease, partial [Thermoanaerobaculia bacterium]|nr:Uma2 family endonuclease [Thermoanaerobaculia bacterium]